MQVKKQRLEPDTEQQTGSKWGKEYIKAVYYHQAYLTYIQSTSYTEYIIRRVLWPPDAKNWLIGKDPDARKDWRQEEKGTTEDEMAGWHHQLDRYEFD